MWRISPLAELQALPTDARAATDWPNLDLAFVNVCEGILAVVVAWRNRGAAAEDNADGGREGRASPQAIAELAPSPRPAQARKRALDAALPRRVRTGSAAALLVMLRREGSSGLRAVVQADSRFGIEKEDVQSTRSIELKFPVDLSGKPAPLDLEVKLDSPDFDPPFQARTITVPPRGDSDPRVFFVTARVAGTLGLAVRLFQGERELASCFLQTQAEAQTLEPTENSITCAGHTLVSVPLESGGDELVSSPAKARAGAPPTTPAPAQPQSGGAATLDPTQAAEVHPILMPKGTTPVQPPTAPPAAELDPRDIIDREAAERAAREQLAWERVESARLRALKEPAESYPADDTTGTALRIPQPAPYQEPARPVEMPHPGVRTPPLAAGQETTRPSTPPIMPKKASIFRPSLALAASLIVVLGGSLLYLRQRVSSNSSMAVGKRRSSPPSENPAVAEQEQSAPVAGDANAQPSKVRPGRASPTLRLRAAMIRLGAGGPELLVEGEITPAATPSSDSHAYIAVCTADTTHCALLPAILSPDTNGTWRVALNASYASGLVPPYEVKAIIARKDLASRDVRELPPHAIASEAIPVTME